MAHATAQPQADMVSELGRVEQAAERHFHEQHMQLLAQLNGVVERTMEEQRTSLISEALQEIRVRDDHHEQLITRVGNVEHPKLKSSMCRTKFGMISRCRRRTRYMSMLEANQAFDGYSARDLASRRAYMDALQQQCEPFVQERNSAVFQVQGSSQTDPIIQNLWQELSQSPGHHVQHSS